MLKEYREFIARGNVVDLAVGLIIGAAFTGVVNSLVKDVIMPPIGVVAGGVDFSNLFLILKGDGHYPSVAAAAAAGAATLNYGLFINTLINFLIVSVAVFFLVRLVNRIRAAVETEKPPTAPAAPTPSEKLLVEIRDILKQKS